MKKIPGFLLLCPAFLIFCGSEGVEVQQDLAGESSDTMQSNDTAAEIKDQNTVQDTAKDIPDFSDAAPQDQVIDPGIDQIISDMEKDTSAEFVKDIAPDQADIQMPDIKDAKDANVDIETVPPPEKFGPVSLITSFLIVSGEDKIKQKCYDFTGDSSPDNAIASASDYFNPASEKAIQSETLIRLLEFTDLSNFTDDDSFSINRLLGVKSEVDGEYYIDPSSFGSDGKSLISFSDASLENSVFEAGPSTFDMPVPFYGIIVEVHLQEVRIKGTITSGSSGGIIIENGSVTGKLYKQDALEAIAKAEEWCKTLDPKPPECSYFDVLKVVFNTVVKYDLDSGNSCSTCFEITGDKAKAAGLLK